MINLGTSTMQDFALGDNLVERIDLGDTTIFDPYTTITGTLPLTFNSRAAVALKNYRIHGTSEGAGVVTENLFNWEKVKLNTGIAWVTGDEIQSDGRNLSDYIPVEAADYTASFNVYFLFYDEQKEYVGRYDGSSFVKTGGVETFSKIPIPYTGYIRILALRAIDDLKTFMFVKNSPLPETYIPYGYKIPILCQSGVTENLWDGTVTEWKNNVLTITKNQDNSFTVSRQSSSTTSYYPAITITSNLITGKKYSLSFKITGLTQEMIDTHPVAGVRNTDSNSFIDGLYTVLNQDGTYETPIAEIPTDFSENYEYCILLVNNATFAFSNITISDIVISERFQSNYDLFLGDSKLYEDEYLDYQEQKIYRTILLTTHDNKDFITSDNKRFCVRRSNNG